MSSTPAPGTPVVDELARRAPDEVSPGGSRTWSVAGRNSVTAITELAAGDRLVERDVPDEHLLLVPSSGGLTVQHAGTTVEVAEPAVVVVPAGSSVVHASAPATVVRVFTARCAEQRRRAINATAPPDLRVAPLPPAPPARTGGVRVHPLRTVPEEDGRLGRVFRTSALMVNWFPVQDGPRDPEGLSPHAHEDFEQLSVTLVGDHAHHLRTPWTPRLSEWRDDVHVQVASPSMTLIPPTVVHTTRAVGAGPHTLVDVFAPPRADFLARGWVLNAEEYEELSGDR